MNFWATFGDGVLVAVGASLIGGLGWAVKLLLKMSHQVEGLSASMRTVYQTQLYMIESDKCQNEALRGIGANGMTRRSDELLDKAAGCFDTRLLEKVGGRE